MKNFNKWHLLLVSTLSIAITSCSTSSTNKDDDDLIAIALPDERPDAIELPKEKKPKKSKKARFYQKGNKNKMTLAYVAERTLFENPDVEIFLAREEQAFHSIDIKKAAYWPTVNVKLGSGIENVYKTSGETLGTNRKEASATIKGTVYDFGKRQKDVEQSEAVHRAAQYRAKVTANNVVLQITEAFIDVLENRELARITNKNILQIHKFRNLVQENLSAGNASVADLKKVEARLENARSNFVDLKAKYEGAKENFKKIAGFYPKNLQPLPKLLHYKKTNLGTNEQMLIQNKYELEAVRHDIDGLYNKLESVKAARLPVLDIAAMANYKENIGGTNDPVKDMRLDFSLKYQVFDGGLKAAEQKKVLAAIREGEALLRKKTQNLQQEIQTAKSDQKASVKKNALLAKRLKAAKRVVSLNTEQFKEGVLTVFELLDAQAQLLNAQQELIINKYKKYRVRFKQLQISDKLLISLIKQN